MKYWTIILAALPFEEYTFQIVIRGTLLSKKKNNNECYFWIAAHLISLTTLTLGELEKQGSIGSYVFDGIAHLKVGCRSMNAKVWTQNCSYTIIRSCYNMSMSTSIPGFIRELFGFSFSLTNKDSMEFLFCILTNIGLHSKAGRNTFFGHFQPY